MDKLSKENVFLLLNEESEFHNNLTLKNFLNSEYSPTEWLMVLRKYLSDAENAAIEDDEKKILSSIRKIGIFCILMLEENGCINTDMMMKKNQK